jgi:hypothetical protein
MQRLEIFQSLWAMERRRPDREEWPLERQFEMIAQAGFDGAGIDHAARETPSVDRARALYRDNGLACLITAFPATTEDLVRTLDAAVSLDARLVCVNARYFPLTVDEGADFVCACLELAAQARMPVCFETHRLTLTNDLLYTLQLLERVPDLQLAADLSHFVVAREFPAPVDRRHQEWIETLLRRSVALQGRVATREQVQVPLHFPQHFHWVEQFFAWWQLGIVSWRRRSPDDAILNFMCELGPPPYAITGADGCELSDRWQEALVLKRRIRELWDTCVGHTP